MLRYTLIYILCAVIYLLGNFNISAQSVAPFKEGDRAVFLGNSITHSGHYHSYIWLYYATRFPNMPITVVNCGIGADSANEMYRRLESDALAANPTVLLFTFGMNDSGYASEIKGQDPQEFAEAKFQRAADIFDKIAGRLMEEPDLRVVMVGTSPYDENAEIPAKPYIGKNETIQRIIDYQMQVADEFGWDFVDFNRPMVEINTRKQVTDPTFTLSGPRDRIHPDNEGDMVMAYLFLKAQGMSGREVASMNINAANNTVIEQKNCSISNLRNSTSGVEFTYFARALPYPVDTVPRGGKKFSQARALDDVPFMEEMNMERLQVTGLPGGTYSLLIDGQPIATLSSAALASGVNLAEYPTPQYRQAERVMRLNEERWRLEKSYRNYKYCVHTYMPLKKIDDSDPAQAAAKMYAHLGKKSFLSTFVDSYCQWTNPQTGPELHERMQNLISEMYRENKPIPRKIQITKL